MPPLERFLSLLGGRSGGAPAAREFKQGQHIHLANPWHAVSIVSARADCPVCSRYKDVRFLATEAPNLPLSDCPDPKACKSVYRHYQDRRAGPRRAVERRAFEPMTPSVVERRVIPDDRRHSGGRRSTDGR
jgi:hypothetical protein